MSKKNDRLTGVTSTTPAINTVAATDAAGEVTDPELKQRIATADAKLNGNKPKTVEQLLAEAKARQDEAEAARKKAEEALALAEEAKKKAEEEKLKAEQAKQEARAKALAEVKAAGRFREAYLPVMADGTLGHAYASPFLAEQASPVGKAEKRLCWGGATGPIGDPLTPEEMDKIYNFS